jgi:hypothetical protein
LDFSYSFVSIAILYGKVEDSKDFPDNFSENKRAGWSKKLEIALIRGFNSVLWPFTKQR